MDVLEVRTKGKQLIYIELTEEPTAVSESPVGGSVASGKATKVIKELAEVGDTIADVCSTLQSRIQGTLTASKPSEITLEFGVKLAGKAGVPLVTEGSVEGTFKVAATWNFG